MPLSWMVDSLKYSEQNAIPHAAAKVALADLPPLKRPLSPNTSMVHGRVVPSQVTSVPP